MLYVFYFVLVRSIHYMEFRVRGSYFCDGSRSVVVDVPTVWEKNRCVCVFEKKSYVVSVISKSKSGVLKVSCGWRQ